MHDRLSFQCLLGLDPLTQRVPDERTVLHFDISWRSTH